MSFETFKNEITSKKIILFEINKGGPLVDILWNRYVPGVWKATFAWEENLPTSTSAYGVGTWGNGTWGTTSTGLLPESPNPETPAIGSLEINGIFYTPMTDKDLVQSNNESFYFDAQEQILYVNFDGYIRSSDNEIIIGKTAGYSNDSRTLERNYYDSRIDSLPSLTINRDNLFKNIAVFGGATVGMMNDDGEFDNFGDLDVYGQSVKIRYGGEDLDYDDYEQLYTGTIEKWSGSGNKFSINIKDDRKSLEAKLPTRYYDETTYPNLAEFGFGTGIGLGYGDVRRAIAVCTNEAEEPIPTNYNFKFVDTTNHNIQSIDKVYVDGVSVTFASGSVTGGTFTLPSSTYEAGQIVTVDFHGYTDGVDLIDHPLDIIEDLLWYYADEPYNSDVFNTVEWEEARTAITSVGTIYIKESRGLINIITDITQSVMGTFVKEGDGRFNIKLVDLEKAAVRTIRFGEILGKVKDKPQFDEYISSARIGYRKNNSNSQYAYYINTSKENGLVKRFRKRNQSTFKTTLSTQTDAIAFSEKIMDLYGGMFVKYTITTSIQYIDLNIEDLVYVEVKDNNDGTFKTIKGEIISKTLDLTGGEVTLIVKEFGAVEEFNVDLVIEYDDNPEYLINYDDNPDYIIKYDKV